MMNSMKDVIDLDAEIHFLLLLHRQGSVGIVEAQSIIRRIVVSEE